MIFTQDSAQTFNDTEFADVYALLGGRGSYPRTLILDSEGVITYTFTGSLHYKDLVAEIEKAKN